MTTPARIREAERASVAFQIALAQIGAETIDEAIALWKRVNPNEIESTAKGWLKAATRLVLTRRGQSREIALAYYRLVRALRTGTTTPSPAEPERSQVLLGDLRREFRELVEATVDKLPKEAREPASERDDDGVEVEVELGDDFLKELERDERELDREAEEEALLVLEALGPDNLDRKRKRAAERERELTAREWRQMLEEAHEEAGRRQAAAAERIAINGGRGALWSAAGRDKRVIGYVRLSRTGTPCGWCAMLISRGPVYKSAKSGSRAIYKDGDLYHDHCKCYSEPVFSESHFNSSPLFELNRRYAKEWPKVTKGLSGKKALSAWRKHIRDTASRQER